MPADSAVMLLYNNLYLYIHFSSPLIKYLPFFFVWVLMISVPVTFFPSVAMARYRDSNFSKTVSDFFKGIDYVDAGIQMLTGARLELHCSTKLGEWVYYYGFGLVMRMWPGSIWC